MVANGEYNPFEMVAGPPSNTDSELPKNNKVYPVYESMQALEKVVKDLQDSILQFGGQLANPPSKGKANGHRGSRVSDALTEALFRQARPQLTKIEETVAQVHQSCLAILDGIVDGLKEIASEALRNEELLIINLNAMKSLKEQAQTQQKEAAVERLVAGARAFLRGVNRRGPTGEVAVACGYIVGAEALWEKDPQSMKVAVAQHDAIVRQLLARHRGHLCHTDPHATVAVFPDPRHCLRYGLDLQRALVEADWRHHLLVHEEAKKVEDAGQRLFRGLAVALGIVTGTPATELDAVTQRFRYSGPAMAKAAAMCGLARGGEICCPPAVLEDLRQRGVLLAAGVGPVDERRVALDPALEPEPVAFVVPAALAARASAWPRPEPEARAWLGALAERLQDPPDAPPSPLGPPAAEGLPRRDSTVLLRRQQSVSAPDVAPKLLARRESAMLTPKVRVARGGDKGKARVVALQCQLADLQAEVRDLADHNAVLSERLRARGFRARALSLPGPRLHTARDAADDRPRVPSAMVISNLQFELAMREKELHHLQIAHAKQRTGLEGELRLLKLSLRCDTLLDFDLTGRDPSQRDFVRLVRRVAELEAQIEAATAGEAARELAHARLQRKARSLEHFFEQNAWVIDAKKRYWDYLEKEALAVTQVEHILQKEREVRQRRDVVDAVERRARSLAAARAEAGRRGAPAAGPAGPRRRVVSFRARLCSFEGGAAEDGPVPEAIEDLNEKIEGLAKKRSLEAVRGEGAALRQKDGAADGAAAAPEGGAAAAPEGGGAAAPEGGAAAALRVDLEAPNLKGEEVESEGSSDDSTCGEGSEDSADKALQQSLQGYALAAPAANADPEDAGGALARRHALACEPEPPSPANKLRLMKMKVEALAAASPLNPPSRASSFPGLGAALGMTRRGSTRGLVPRKGSVSASSPKAVARPMRMKMPLGALSSPDNGPSPKSGSPSPTGRSASPTGGSPSPTLRRKDSFAKYVHDLRVRRESSSLVPPSGTF